MEPLDREDLRKIQAPGVEAAWTRLAAANPADVVKNSLAAYDGGKGIYTIKSLGMDYAIDPKNHELCGLGDDARGLRQKHPGLFDLGLLWYMTSARDIGHSGRMIKPEALKGGHHFFKGAHELPLKRIASMYGRAVGVFVNKAQSLQGQKRDFGDAAFELYPMPRVPVTMILWLSDEEFSPRVDLLFDSSCEFQAPLDILWCAAMSTCLAFL